MELRVFNNTKTLCARTPCVVRLGPGAFDLSVRHLLTKRRCGVSVQLPSKPAVLLLSLPPQDVFADCGVTLWAPENGVTYEGGLQ